MSFVEIGVILSVFNIYQLSRGDGPNATYGIVASGLVIAMLVGFRVYALRKGIGVDDE